MAITDLTNTTWNIPAGWTCSAGYGEFSVTVKLDDDTLEYSGLTIGSYFGSNDGMNWGQMPSADIIEVGMNVRRISSQSFTMTITGGADATNTKLISWLEANGTQVIEMTPKEQFVSQLNELSDAINEKAETSGKMTISQMIENVKGISGVELNIHYGTTTPSDTTKLWVKRDITPSKVSMTSEVNAASVEKIETLSVKLPTALYGICCAAVGTKVYLFGGWQGATTIQVFDTTNNTLTTLSTKLSKSISLTGCAAVGNKIYLFGGNNSGNRLNTIQVFNTTNNTISTLNTTLPNQTCNMGCAAVRNKIYLFGGYYGYNMFLDTIQVFDTTNNTLTTLSTTLPKVVNYICCAAVGTKIYLFGGQSYTSSTINLNEIQVFNTETQTIETLSTTLSTALYGLCCAAVENKIYLFGGYGTERLDIIQVFDTTTNTRTTLSTTLPTTLQNGSCAAVGNKIYLFGGNSGSGGGTSLDTINLFSIIKDLDLTSNNLLLHSQDVGTFKLFNSETLDIEAKVGDCYYGNSNNKGEQVKIAVYKDSAWSELN